MKLADKILADLQAAMRAKDDTRRSTLRLVRAAITNVQMEADSELEEEQVRDILEKEAKRRREAIEEFSQANRYDLVDKTRAELTIIEEYLPKQLSRQEIEALVEEVITELTAQQLTIGELMRRLMPKIKGRADGRIVNQIVQEKLNQKGV